MSLPTVPTRDVAHALMDAGMAVMVLRPGQKTPATVNGLKDATRDDHDKVDAWFDKVPGLGLGVACGPSGLVVIDCDAGKPWPEGVHQPAGVRDGIDHLFAITEALGHDPGWWFTVPAVATPSGGLHFYLRAPAAPTIRNGANRPGVWIDVRAAGGYVVAPFSSTDAGEYRPAWGWSTVTHLSPRRAVQAMTYGGSRGPKPWPGLARFEVLTDPPEVPTWLSDVIGVKPPAAVDPLDRLLAGLEVRGIGTGYAQAALAGEAAAVRASTEPGRNHRLNHAAFALGTLIASGADLSEDDVVAELLAAARTAGLTDAEARRTIASGLRGGKAKPRQVSA